MQSTRTVIISLILYSIILMVEIKFKVNPIVIIISGVITILAILLYVHYATEFIKYTIENIKNRRN